MGVVMGCKDRESGLNIFWGRNRSQILETLIKYESKVLLRK
ncbi:uncharacterized protein G2W53_022219 [Senna tora]|uniref:Uncharacterized protein n=1 Tax=Senna tora TaxID=362788 RepID=A0A834WHY1_9FABA|nr:uncharacterized protein G2W53_022219 [Senna tora]